MGKLLGTIGGIGEQYDLLIGQGDDFGPHEVTLSYLNGDRVNLSGGSLVGGLKKLGGGALIPFTTSIIDGPQGVGTFGLERAKTALLEASENINANDSAYRWALKYIDAAGLRHPVYFGSARVHLSVV